MGPSKAVRQAALAFRDYLRRLTFLFSLDLNLSDSWCVGNRSFIKANTKINYNSERDYFI